MTELLNLWEHWFDLLICTCYKSNMYKNKVYKIYEARKDLSSIVSDASISPAIIGKRGKPSVVIVDYEMAIKYLPKAYMEEKKIPSGTKLAEYAKTELEKMKKTKWKPTTNYSERVDEIVYGIKKQ